MPHKPITRGVWIPVDDWIRSFQDAQRAEYGRDSETHAEVERNFDFPCDTYPRIQVVR